MLFKPKWGRHINGGFKYHELSGVILVSCALGCAPHSGVFTNVWPPITEHLSPCSLQVLLYVCKMQKSETIQIKSICKWGEEQFAPYLVKDPLIPKPAHFMSTPYPVSVKALHTFLTKLWNIPVWLSCPWALCVSSFVLVPKVVMQFPYFCTL